MRQILLLLVLLFSLESSSQILKAKIIAASGDPVSNATIYIPEITLGIVADEQGKFQTKLNPGTYTCQVRSIGFESQTKRIEISSDKITDIQIILTEKPLKLNEVVITPSKENPAYNIMRHAIARASFHLYQVSNYTSENYLKGSAKIEKIPGLMKMMINDKKLLSLIGKLMVLESQNQILFQSPSKYTQKVIAYKSSIPKDLEPKGGIRIPTSSVYEPFFMDEISPLSPQAFRYYQFKLEDIFTSGNYQVNKIRIIPKVKNGKLFSGYVYIVDDNWSVYALDLTETEMGSTVRTKIDYQEVKPNVFMPIAYDVYTNIGTMGVKGYARFYSSVKYKSIKLNESSAVAHIQKAVTKSVQLVSKKQHKMLDKIDELSAKDKISTRDAIKLARLTTQIIEPKELKDQKESIEIKDVEKIKMEIDSLAEKRDSTFWEDVRSVPLRTDEAESFVHNDSLLASKNIKATNNSIEFNLGNSKKSTSVLAGGSIGLGKSTRFTYNGLLRGLLKEYNFVDGAWLGQSMSLYINTTKTNKLIFSPDIYYSTARKSIIFDVNSQYQYAPLANGRLLFSIRNTSENIQQEQGTSRFFNSISSLFFGDNAIRFYQNKSIGVENKIDIINGLSFTLGTGYANRQLLSNHTSYHFLGNAPEPNFPSQSYSDAFPNNSITAAWTKIEYTPFYRYRIKDGKKEYVSSAYPTFELTYKKAIPILNKTEQASYDKINLLIRQRVQLSEFDRFNYSVSLGTFLMKDKIYAPDYKYFVTSPLLVTDKTFENSFGLLENYTNSSSRWMEAHLSWNSDYLFLKRVRFLQHYLFNEVLQVSLLSSEQNKTPYMEFGYSIGFNNLGRIGVFGSFDGLNYKNTGIKISIPLFLPQEQR